MPPARKLDAPPVADRREGLDVPLSAEARAALDAGLESARADLASGRPLTAWADFTAFAVGDDDE